MSDAADLEAKLRLELLQVDIMLKQKQAFWETPRNLAILVATVAAVAGALGYKFGQAPQQPIVIQLTTTGAKP